MSNLFSGINARFRPNPPRAGPPSPNPTHNPSDDQAPASTASRGYRMPPGALSPSVPPLQSSPSLSESIGIAATTSEPTPAPAAPATHAANTTNAQSRVDLPRPLPLWLNNAYTKHIVKGNFMTLSARPKTVEQGEWMAHQVVEHFRLLWNFVRVVFDPEENGTSICSPTTCPKMSAGSNHSYTWLNSRYEPVELPAREYMSLMQRWISGKLDDTTTFPADPAGVSFALNPSITGGVLNEMAGADDYLGKRSGFPPNFGSICKTLFLQMLRVYSHLYWDHFVDPFYNLNLEKQLNSCFSHFILTATSLDLLTAEDLEPMHLLLDLWAANGTFPPESRAYRYADVEMGKYIMSLSPIP